MLLLTSHSEGFGLVLLESMAEGCIPFAYDVPYGPADIITDGVNGFLVPAGDVEALAARIHEFLALDEAAVEELRRNARATAAAYSDENITALWSAALRSRRLTRTRAGVRRRSARLSLKALRDRLGRRGRSALTWARSRARFGEICPGGERCASASWTWSS